MPANPTTSGNIASLMFPIKRDNGFRHIHRQLSCSTLFMASVFREVFSRMTAEYSINATALPLKRKRRRGSAVSDAEVTTVVMPFHSYSVVVRCVFIPGMREVPGHLFFETVSHNRFIELRRKAAKPFCLIQIRYFQASASVSLADSAPLCVCRSRRIHICNTFKRLAACVHRRLPGRLWLVFSAV